MGSTYEELKKLYETRKYYLDSVPEQIMLLFDLCKRYWRMICQYKCLKEGQRHLAQFWDKEEMNYRDRRFIDFFWKEVDIEAVMQEGKLQFLDVDWMAFAERAGEKIDKQTEIWNHAIEACQACWGYGLEGDLQGNPDNLIEKYTDGLKVLLDNKIMKEKSTKESVEHVLTESYRKKLIICMQQENPQGDAWLTMLLAEAISRLSGVIEGKDSFRIQGYNRNPEQGNFMIFTEECTCESDRLKERIETIIKKYINGEFDSVEVVESEINELRKGFAKAGLLRQDRA